MGMVLYFVKRTASRIEVGALHHLIDRQRTSPLCCKLPTRKKAMTFIFLCGVLFLCGALFLCGVLLIFEVQICQRDIHHQLLSLLLV
jgi:hypothetical protein